MDPTGAQKYCKATRKCGAVCLRLLQMYSRTRPFRGLQSITIISYCDLIIIRRQTKAAYGTESVFIKFDRGFFNGRVCNCLLQRPFRSFQIALVECG